MEYAPSGCCFFHQYHSQLVAYSPFLTSNPGLGKAGTLLSRGVNHAERIAGFSVTAVDTTAAGDTFNGALVVKLHEGWSLVEAVRFGNAAAALSVTRRGAQTSVPGLQEVVDFLHQQ